MPVIFDERLWRPPEPSISDPKEIRTLIAYQEHEVLQKFPRFSVVMRSVFGIQWIGTVQPIAQRYRIQVSFLPGVLLPEVEFAYQSPMVHVLEPRLEHRYEAPHERLPHVYREAYPPHLCLYYPGNWSMWRSVADTIIPWACEWFARYEMWHATGDWTGPARHPGDGKKHDGIEALSPSCPDPISTTCPPHRIGMPVMRSMSYLVRRYHQAPD